MNDRYSSNMRPSSNRRSAPESTRQSRAGERRYADDRYARPRSATPERNYARRDSRYCDDRYARPRSAAPERDARRQAPVRSPNNRPRRRKGGNILVKILRGILMVFLAVFGGISSLFSGLNRKLDVFRRSETSAVIVNCILGGVVVSVLLLAFMLCKPGMDASRARTLAARGEAASAVKIVSRLEADGYNEAKLAETRIAVAQRLISAGEYDAALSLADEMSDGVAKDELRSQGNYAKAVDLYEAGNYAAAAQIFYQNETYRDSAQRYADCRCALAIEAWQQGDETSARSLLLDVPDVAQRVAAAAVKVTGSEAGAQQVLAAELFRADNLNRMEQTMEEINAARSKLPEGRIAAGRYHTLALKSDGTLLGAGDNSLGQLNIAGWSGITRVAAGAYHTVGLRTDGTVLATGDNSQGQCDVSGWTDIIAIAASACDTIGLKSDGTVVACGKNSAKVSGWHDVTFVTGGSYSLGCLYNNGAMLASHAGAQMGMGVTLYDLSVCGPVSVGVLYDGSVISTYENAPAWTDMVSVTVCETGILGIDVNGRVQSHFYRASDAVDFSFSGAALAVESSGTHHVVLTSDGRVYAFGNNDYGQCAVNDWQL